MVATTAKKNNPLFDEGNVDLLNEILGSSKATELITEENRSCTMQGFDLEADGNREVVRKMNEALRRQLMKAHALPFLCRGQTARSLAQLHVEALIIYHY